MFNFTKHLGSLFEAFVCYQNLLKFQQHNGAYRPNAITLLVLIESESAQLAKAKNSRARLKDRTVLEQALE